MRTGWNANNPFVFLLGAGVVVWVLYQIVSDSDKHSNKPRSSKDISPG